MVVFAGCSKQRLHVTPNSVSDPPLCMRAVRLFSIGFGHLVFGLLTLDWGGAIRSLHVHLALVYLPSLSEQP